ncbi:MAG: hypothetical protein K5858_07410 [Lachnospiraceae bacterium]|nr:hypothetical protein [Lachnospiraceae bacterium]
MRNPFKKMTDTLKRDRETMKGLSSAKKAEFIWDYYKVPIAIIATVLFVCISLVTTFITRGGNVLYVVMVNAGVPESAGEDAVRSTFTELLESSGENMKGKKINLECNYSLSFDEPTDSDIATLQVLSALFGIGDLDLFVSDKDVYDKFALKNGFSDLRAYIPSDILSANEDKIYYYTDEKGNTAPVGIYVKDTEKLTGGGTPKGELLAGIVSRAENAERAGKVLESLLIVQN